MNQTLAPFSREEKSTVAAVLAGVFGIAGVYVYFLLFAGFAFVDRAGAVVNGGNMQAILAALGTGGVVACVVAAKTFKADRARRYLAGGFAVCLVAALLSLKAANPFWLGAVALLIGCGVGWTTVVLSLCLRPTLHFNKLGMWCGLGTGLAYAVCNQPMVFEASLEGKTFVAAGAAAVGMIAAIGMKGGVPRPSSLPDFEGRAAWGWIVALFAMVFLDTVVFYVIQHSAVLRQLAWETPLVLQGNAFVHLCAAFITGLVLDQRRAGACALVALLVLLASGLMLGLGADQFPMARILYVMAVSIYSTVLIYLPARGGRPMFTASLFSLAGWMGSGLALSLAVGADARQVPMWVLAATFFLGVSALFARMLWVRRMHEIEAEALVTRAAS